MINKIIIDTDPGCDDMLALLLMCAAPSIEICAVTTVAGNSTLQNVTNNAQYILRLAGRLDIPLCSGAEAPLTRKPISATVHGPSGLGDITVSETAPLNGKAVNKIIDTVRQNPGEISLLILGPQTNIATAIRRDPETMRKVKEFIIMGGAFKVPGNQNMVGEFNISVDPEAAAIVAEFPVKKTYIPLDICNQVQVPLSEFARINNPRIRKAVVSALVPYIRNIRRSELKTRGALMYDVLAGYYLLKPELCSVSGEALYIETMGEYTYGMTLLDKRPTKKKQLPNANIVTNIPEKQFIDDYFSILGEYS